MTGDTPLLTALPQCMQESGARGIWGVVRADRVTVGTSSLQRPMRQRHGAAMGRNEKKGTIKEANRDERGQKPGEWGETLGAARPPEWTLSPT